MDLDKGRRQTIKEREKPLNEFEQGRRDSEVSDEQIFNQNQGSQDEWPEETQSAAAQAYQQAVYNFQQQPQVGLKPSNSGVRLGSMGGESLDEIEHALSFDNIPNFKTFDGINKKKT